MASTAGPVLTNPGGVFTTAPGRWAAHAACGSPTLDPAVWAVFTADDRTPHDPAAVAICRICPVLGACDRYARTTRYLTGIWGARRRSTSRAPTRPS